MASTPAPAAATGASAATGAPTATNNHAHRFAFIDVARGIAALLVMLQHSLEGGGIEALTAGSIATSWLNLGETGVAIFFLVSGFIIPASVKGTTTVREFVIRRVLRIYPLYWATFVLTLAISLMLRNEAAPPVIKTLLTHLVFVQSWLHVPNYVGGSWTLFIEMIWYIAFATAFFSFFGVGLRLVVGFLIAYLLVTIAATAFLPNFPFGRLSIFALCFYGYLYLLIFEEKIGRRAFIAGSAVFLTLIAANILVGFYFNPSGAVGAPTFVCVAISWTIALALFPFLLLYRNSAFARAPILRYLGEISYSVYLLHSPVMTVLHVNGITGVTFIVLTFSITIILATITYRFIEKPGVALARTMTRKLKP